MNYKIEFKNGSARVVLDGGLTEKSQTNLSKLVRDLAGTIKHVDFDCSGITAINSTGVAQWVAMLEELDKGISYEFSRCSIFFIDYANLITEITNGAPIVSFYVPMKCQSCGKSASPLMMTSQVDVRRGFGEHACASCKGGLVPEVDPEDYLAFLEQA